MSRLHESTPEIVATRDDNVRHGAFSFGFVSLVPFAVYVPAIQTAIRKNSQTSSLDKIALKQTFLLLTWFFLFSQSSSSSSSSSPLTPSVLSSRKIRLIRLPRQRNIFTTVRAPIAHKTFSKEQFKFELFRVTVKVVIERDPFRNVNALFTIIYQLESSSLANETNLLYLRYNLFKWILTDARFFRLAMTETVKLREIGNRK